MTPIRLADLTQRSNRIEVAEREALATIAELQASVAMTQLAINAQVKALPSNSVINGTKTDYYRLIPGLRAILDNKFITYRTPERTILNNHFNYTMNGKEILIPGRVFAVLNQNQTASYTLTPTAPKLVQYNEILLPCIGTPYNITLYGDTSAHTYHVSQTQIIKLDQTRNWNGAVTVSATALTGDNGEFIHAIAGIRVSRITFKKEEQFEVIANVSFQSPPRTPLVKVYPGEHIVNYTITDNTGTPISNTNGILNTIAGETYQLRFSLQAAQQAEYISLTYEEQ